MVFESLSWLFKVRKQRWDLRANQDSGLTIPRKTTYEGFDFFLESSLVLYIEYHHFCFFWVGIAISKWRIKLSTLLWWNKTAESVRNPFGLVLMQILVPRLCDDKSRFEHQQPTGVRCQVIEYGNKIHEGMCISVFLIGNRDFHFMMLVWVGGGLLSC